MGNEQSSGSGVGENSSITFLTQKARGISPKPVRPKQVVVVNAGIEENLDINRDEDFIRLQKIPFFYPILRNSLNIPGVKDPPDVATKFDHRSFHTLCHRVQEHLAINSDVICNEQVNLGTRIREIDYAISTLTNCLTDRHKQYAKFVVDLNKIREINCHLMKITSILQEIVPMAENLNELLPETDRLPPLNLASVLQPAFVPEGTDEQKVIDQNATDNLSAAAGGAVS